MTLRSPAAITVLCIAALCCFAANSLLCRAALGAHVIDAASFTAIRLVSGAAVLAILARGAARGAGSWTSGLALFAYAAAFSFAYLRLTAATGALILFGLVQITMIGSGVARGERPRALEWVGIALSVGGLVALALPGLAAPDPGGAALMAVAGISWGVYSLRGRGATDPLAVTADNFVRSLPLAALLVLVGVVANGARGATISMDGVVLATASGALASGLGYSLWYAVLPQLTSTRAAIVQLLVPVLAASAGALLLAEPLTLRFASCAAAILGGVALSVVTRRR